MHFEKGFCENNCVQKTTFIPDAIGKSSLKREQPFLAKFVLNVNICFIQYNKLLEKHVKKIQNKNLFCQERMVFC